MNTITNAERDELIAAARESITLDDHGEIVGGFEPAWRWFADEYEISYERARSYVAKAARLMRGERLPVSGRPAVLSEPGTPITVWLEPRHVGAAQRAGGGNMSAGIRTALEYWERTLAK